MQTINIPDSILTKVERKLHLNPNHPICIIKEHIYKYFDSLSDYNFKEYDDLSPYTDTTDNFDRLLIPKDHSSRSKSDTYYVTEYIVLRTHTSAHQNELFSKGITQFLVTGDVYRKDEIDRYHYPVFHQMEGVSIVPSDKNPSTELKKILSGLTTYLFPNHAYRFNNDYFPFIEPSFEIEVEYKKDVWIEILGCGFNS